MDGWRVLEQAGELTRRKEAFALATVVWRQGPSSGQQGSRAIITASGELTGWIGGACAEPAVLREARQVIAEGVPRLLLLGTPDQFGAPVPEGMTVVPIACQSEGALQVYIEPVLPAPHLVIVGRSPMAQTLADLALALGWRAVLMDGPDFCSADADERSMVVVATQGHGDEEAVTEAVAARPAYVGLVGSHRRGASVLGYLAERGIPADQLDRVHVPAGLDLGRTSHREIAVAILAELVQLRASGALAAAASAGTELRAPGAPAAAASAGTQGTRPTAGTTGTAGAPAADPAAPAGQAFPEGTAGPGGRRGRSGPAGPGGREGRSGPAGPGGAARAAQAADPVCGMTMTAGPAGYPLEHEGVTYYFCCAGCRRAFEQDPAAHVKRETRC